MWHENQIKQFEDKQRRKREYINVAEIVEWYSELGGSGPDEARREEAWRIIEHDVLIGVFVHGGQSEVLFRCPGVSWVHGKMTPLWLKDAIDHDWDGEHGRYYLRHCWLRREIFQDWCARHCLPTSAPRFQQLLAPTGCIPERQAAKRLPPMPKKNGPQKEAWKALKARFPNELIPNDMTGASLRQIVNKYIKKLPSDVLEGRVRQEISLESVLRAVGRRK
jgi:hypothetical protein